MTYCFDEFRLETATRRLMRGDREAHISPKAFDLLLVLIENGARAMSRRELHDELWPSTFVLETNLASLVKEIRRALSDAPHEPRFIRTVHRFGYWFIAPVQCEPDGPETVAPPVRYWLIWDTRQVPLAPGENILGRAPDASIWIDASGVSRHHARILLADTQATLEDLGSKNGTYVDGERVASPRTLADGDQIRIGPVVVTFRVPPPVGSTETVPA